MNSSQDIKTTQSNNDNGSKPQPLGMQGAVLAHSLRQLAAVGYPFEVEETPDGVVIRVSRLRKAVSRNGNLVFDGVGA